MAPGFRDSGLYGLLGALTRVSNSGYSWSSSFSGTSGVFLYFFAQSLNPSGSDRRAYGLQLRCLSE